MEGAMRYYRIIALSLVFLACTGPGERSGEPGTGVYHCVEAGETLWSIARLYGQDAATLARVNGIDDPASLPVDTVLFVPGAGRTLAGEGEGEEPPDKPAAKVTARAPPAKRPSPGVSAGAPKEREKQKNTASSPPALKGSQFIWPVQGAVLSTFGRQSDGMVYNGIRIGGREGASVKASASGTVIHSAMLKYYGETVILKHGGGYCTVYAHLKDRKVKAGDRVRQGEPIARVGTDEKKGIPCLHFEIRKGNRPRDPLKYLSSREG